MRSIHALGMGIGIAGAIWIGGCTTDETGGDPLGGGGAAASTTTGSSAGGSGTGGSGAGGSGGSAGSAGAGGAVDPGSLTMQETEDRIVVTSSMPPTWRLEFAVGSGSPGGGTAIALHVPAGDSESVVQPLPDQTCCSGFALDNLEWRWRPWGSTSGTRSDCGTDSTVTSLDIIESGPQRLEFEVAGHWPGVQSFTRRVVVTPEGFEVHVDATYSGTADEDSMWWVISMFHPDKMDGPNVTISDGDTGPVPLGFTPGSGTPLPSGITLPYQVHFPLTHGAADAIHLTVTQMADDQGNQIYEFFNQGNDVPAVGDYYMFYPRWAGSFEHKIYQFEYSWQLSD